MKHRIRMLSKRWSTESDNAKALYKKRNSGSVVVLFYVQTNLWTRLVLYDYILFTSILAHNFSKRFLYDNIVCAAKVALPISISNDVSYHNNMIIELFKFINSAVWCFKIIINTLKIHLYNRRKFIIFISNNVIVLAM